MPNRSTAVPARPVPPLRGAMAAVVVVADLFMGLMLSRPGGLSLRTAWVTPATLGLCLAMGVAALALGALLVVRGGWPADAGAGGLAVLGVGSLAVVLVGIVERRRRDG